MRTNGLSVGYNPEFRSIITEMGEGDTKVIFIPGVAMLCDRMFSSINENLLGRDGVCTDYVDYAGFYSQTGLQEDLLKITSEAPNNIAVALSFGAAVFTDILLHDPQLQSRFSHLVLLSPFFYLDRDSTFTRLAKFQNSLPYSVQEFLSSMSAWCAIRKFKVSESLQAMGITKQDLIAEQNFASVKARMEFYTQFLHPNPYLYGKINTPTTLCWWEKDMVGLAQQQEVYDCFENVTLEPLSGTHGSTESNSQLISEIILSVVNSADDGCNNFSCHKFRI